MRLHRRSLGFVMAAASAVAIALVITAAAVVLWRVGRIEQAMDRQRAAERLHESALNMNGHLRDQQSAVWRTLLVGDPRGRSASSTAASEFLVDLQQYARGATSPDRVALAASLQALHREYTARGLALLDRTAADSRLATDASHDVLEFLALQERLEREVYQELERLRATDLRRAQDDARAQLSAMVTVLSTIAIALFLPLTVGVLLLRRYLQRSVRELMWATDAFGSTDLAFRLDWSGAAEFLPVAERFNEIQERLEASHASRVSLEQREAMARAAHAALSTEAAASAEMLRIVQNAARSWRQTFDAVDFVMLTVDRQGTLQRVNRAAVTLLGGRFDDWIGRPLAEFPDAQPWIAIRALVTDALASGRPHQTQIDDGTAWEIACTGFAEEEFSVVWARDITATAELRRAVARSEAMGAMGELLAGVAHEVRNPLFAITALLDAWSLKPEIQEGPFLRMLRGEVDRMRQLMEELLEYGRPFNSSLDVGDLKYVAAEAISILSPAARARNLTIKADVSGLVRMDKARMLRVFLNLIQNAIDHSPDGAQIEVDSWIQPNAEPQTIQISVRDHGPGFTEADLPRVFTPFFTRRAGGTGLGLPIVQRILEEHGGEISVGNHREGGARVRVQLPLTGAAAPA